MWDELKEPDMSRTTLLLAIRCSMVRKTVFLFASMVLAMLLFTAASGTAPTAAQEGPAKPNFVFILADDMRKDDLKYMPKTNALLGDQGMRFENAFVSYGLCCPSRATIMRGQYAHNTDVWSNKRGPDGGWEGYQNHGNEQDNVATRLHDAGYRTGLFGKYFNGYYDTAHVPPGWDDWFGKFTRFTKSSRHYYYNYDVNDNGTIKHFGSTKTDYSTDVIRQQAKEFIGASVAEGKPFLAYVAPSAPHGPAIPARRHLHTFDGEQAPRLPSFNEEDVSDKPPWIQSKLELTEAQIASIDTTHENRVESLQALDSLVEGMVNQLRREEALSNTYVVFTSDNGSYYGEHRINMRDDLTDKSLPYEESLHMPLLIRGPGVQAGSTTDALTLNTDFLPTFTDLGGIQTPEYVDGRSLRSLIEGDADASWRTAILLERRNLKEPGSSLYGIRTEGGKKYIEYEGGFRELYDLRSDPHELANSYDTTAPPLDLMARLQALEGCAGETCRTAEDRP